MQYLRIIDECWLMRMKRIAILSIIAAFLYLTSVEVLAHNHPLWQGENNTCPAYILANSLNLEQATPILFTPESVPLFEISLLNDEPFIQKIILLPFSRRGPPSFN